MSEIKPQWTVAQQSAIDLESKDILVSAAAGSGKTSVLTARILRKILDPQNPLDISEMLVVTYTKAAARDLKAKIAKELRAAIASDPTNSHLVRQQFHLPNAQIATIHSFCFHIIRENFQQLGLNAKLRVADTAEITILQDTVMNQTIHAYYNGLYTDISDFALFADSFSGDRDNFFAESLLGWYHLYENYIEGLDLLKKNSEELESLPCGAFFDTLWGKTIRDGILGHLKYYQNILTEAITLFDTNEIYQKKFAGFYIDVRTINRLIACCEKNDFERALEAIAEYHADKKANTSKNLGDLLTPEVDFYNEVRGEWKKSVTQWADDFSMYLPDTIAPLISDTAKFAKALYQILKRFETMLNAEKRARGILDFNDLEHYAIQLLYRPDGSVSQIAADLSLRYREIFIDEYQDVNETQDAIFRAFSCSSNRFLVGDIKQSIYGFRGAQPFLFSQYRDSFPIYNPTLGAKAQNSIFLSNNFRCDRAIIEVSNHIFAQLFRHNSCRVPYYEEDALVFSKSESKAPTPVTVVLTEAPITSKKHSADEEEKQQDVGTNDAEILYLAQEIQKLIAEGIQPKDIAILMRSFSESVISQLETVFSAYGIPLQNQKEVPLLQQPEILLVLSLLRTIDNPANDIALTSVLLSPLFHFTVEDLAEIRSAQKEQSLYFALCAYGDSHPEDQKCAFFRSELQRYQTFASSESVDKILWFLYRETGLFYWGSKDEENRIQGRVKAHCMQLYEYAREYEATSFCGLYRFLLYINDVTEKKRNLDLESNSTNQNAVQVMTIHKSKGLEFRVCFVVGCHNAPNNSDLRAPNLFSKELGIAPKLRDESGIVIYDTPLRHAITEQLSWNQIDEEMRVLYVALTRAKERLYITGKVTDREKKLRLWSLGTRFASPLFFRRYHTFLDWVMFTTQDLSSALIRICCPSSETMQFDNTHEQVKESFTQTTYDSKEIRNLEETYRQRFSYEYPGKIFTTLPSKLSVSQLSPEILDEESRFLGFYDDQSTQLLARPMFLEPFNDAATAAQKGTATHIFMQFANFENAEKEGVITEIQRLSKERFLDPNMLDLIQIESIQAFLESEFYQKVWKTAEEVHREVRFNIRVPAEMFTMESEKKEALKQEYVFVQGVIDCILKVNGRYVLIDYKTDHFSHDMLCTPEKVEQILKERHQAQLNYYRMACKQLLGEEVSSVYLYSFALKSLIEIP